MAERTIAAGMARGLVGFAASRGADPRALAERAGLDLAALQNQDARLPFAAYVGLMRAAKALTGDAALALHFGEQVRLAEFSIVGLIGQTVETMMDGFAQLNRYVRLIVETENEGGGYRFQLARHRGGLWVFDSRRNANDFPELTESAFAQIVCSTRQARDTPFVREVHVTHPDPGYRAEYERIFQAPVAFDSDWNAVRVDESWLSAEVSVRVLPRYAFDVLRERADALLQSLESSKTTRGRVEALLTPLLHTGEAGMDRIAGQMGLSRQTLFRKLKAEGVTFEKILDELRRDMAVRYLGGQKVSVNETAYMVGFSDPAAFSRAFKRWTGSSPRTLRMAQA